MNQTKSKQEILEVLGLVRIPTENGSLYLYPEYVDIADRFIQPPKEEENLRISPCGKVRKVCKVTPYDGSEAYVSKEERAEDDCYRRALYKRVPKHGNMTVKDISVARALSELGEFQDDKMFVRFERPYGYFEDKDGKRTGLFHYESRGCPKYSKDSKEVKEIQPDEFMEIKTRLRTQERERLRRNPYITNCFVEAEDGRISSSYFSLEEVIRDLYVPEGFAKMLMESNGVNHNETIFDKGRFYVDEEGRYGVFILDFEFIGLVPRGKINASTKGVPVYDTCDERIETGFFDFIGDSTSIEQVWTPDIDKKGYKTGVIPPVPGVMHALRRFVGIKDPLPEVKPGGEELMQNLRQRIAEMDKRVFDLTGVDRTSEDSPVTKAGPAYDFVEYAMQLQDPAELVVETK